MSIPNLNGYIQKLNCTDKALLNELRLNIHDGIEYFNSMFVVDIENIEDFESKTKLILNKGYEIFFKINTNLDYLHIIDESQTNKYKYEEAIGISMSLSIFVNSIQDLFYNHSFDIDKNVKLAKITKNCPYLCENFKNDVEEQKKLNQKTKINVFNNYINQYIFMLSKINLIIRNIRIY